MSITLTQYSFSRYYFCENNTSYTISCIKQRELSLTPYNPQISDSTPQT